LMAGIKVSSYFINISPEKWKISEFYKYRQQGNDFTSSFWKEAFILRRSLNYLMKGDSSEVKNYATLLDKNFKARNGHRTSDMDSKLFWDKIELQLDFHAEIEMREREMQLAENECFIQTDEWVPTKWKKMDYFSVTPLQREQDQPPHPPPDQIYSLVLKGKKDEMEEQNADLEKDRIYTNLETLKLNVQKLDSMTTTPSKVNNNNTAITTPIDINTENALQQTLLLKLGLKSTELIGHYAIQKTIGEGSFSKVKLAIDLSNCQKVAIKIIGIKGIQDSERVKSSVLREVEMLKFINHPNIVRLFDVVDISTHFCLILEYIPGGELFDYVNDYYEETTEQDSKQIFLQLVDILTDFGLAKFVDPTNPLLSTRCGSEEYAAPELISGKSPYDGKKTDIWSLGIILYSLLVGYLPFNFDGPRKQFLHKIIKAEFDFPKTSMEGERGRRGTISNEAKDLIKKILMSDPDKRFTLEEISNHEWLK
ncbi:4614_t:CDS:2, partial [Entrophospora sp. SA101]